MTHPKFKPNRRQFLGSTLGSMAYWAAMSSPLGLIRKSMAGNSTLNKRYLINIQAEGGWDMHWFHSTFSKEQANFGAANLSPTPATGTPTGVTENYFHQRYPDNLLMTHPNRFDTLLGYGMQYVFGTSSDLIANDIAIVKGLSKEFDHQVGNKMLMHSSISSYALSFSALIAQGIASADYQRPLHYVQLTGTPDEFNSNWAFNTGAAVPVNIADYPTFNGLTSPNSSELSSASQVNLVNAAVNQLSQIASSKFSLSTSKTVYSTFLNSFQNAAQLGTTNLAQSDRFFYLFRTYLDAISANVYGMFASGFTNNLLPLIGTDGNIYGQMQLTNATQTGGSAQTALSTMKSAGYDWTVTNPYTSYADALASEGTTDSTKRTWIQKISRMANGLNPNSGASMTIPVWFQQMLQQAFNFAMAEFMVREDLAAVIDLPTQTSDAHDFSDDHLIRIVMTFTSYKTLLTNLKSTGNLANTTVVMWSELDRTPNWEIQHEIMRRGTNHNATTSMLFAGYGVSGGKVIGGVMDGPGGLYYGQSGLSGIAYSNPLPIDIGTGLVSAGSSGVIPSTQCVLPTMMAIFGFTVPPQQVTDGVDLPCIRSG